VSAHGRNSGLAAYNSVSVHGGVASADPHHLVQMLLDAATERMLTARGCIERGQTVRKAKLLHSCVILIAELRGILNMAEGGSLAQNLSVLYGYITRQLLLANLNNDTGRITEALGLLGNIRSAWAEIGPQVRQSADHAQRL
jgi:flagellar secretion chaperone FliS